MTTATTTIETAETRRSGEVKSSSLLKDAADTITPHQVEASSPLGRRRGGRRAYPGPGEMLVKLGMIVAIVVLSKLPTPSSKNACGCHAFRQPTATRMGTGRTSNEHGGMVSSLQQRQKLFFNAGADEGTSSSPSPISSPRPRNDDGVRRGGGRRHRHSNGRTELMGGKGNDDDGVAKRSLEYVDDCFGLIFLTSDVVLKDATLSTFFLLLSLIALVLCRNGVVRATGVLETNHRRRLPAIVAATSIVSTLLVSYLLPIDATIGANPDFFFKPATSTTRLIEVAVCGVSVVYGILSKDENEEG